MTNARTIYRDFFMDFATEKRRWRIVAITHSLTGRTLLPPALNYPGLATAERYAKAAIDEQLLNASVDSPWRRRGPKRV